MLTGHELGAAIEAARKKKGVTKRALAAHFGVKPPSIQDWVKRGTIDKEKLPMLWEYFAEVVGPSHWGLADQQAFITGGIAPKDAPVAPAVATTSSIALKQALPVVLAHLPGLSDYRAGQVIQALQAAAHSTAPLDQIERDLLQWLTEPRAIAPPPAPRKQASTG